VDARNLSDAGGTGSTVIDPGTKAVTLYLGPYEYFFSQVKLENNFIILGMGDVNQATTGTQITQVLAGTDLFVLGTASSSGAVYGTSLKNFRVFGASTSSGNLFNLVAAGASGGLIYANWEDLTLQNFGGTGIAMTGPSGSQLCQLSRFTNIKIFRPNTSGSVNLSLTGNCGQMAFYDCVFNGGANNGLGTNIVIATSAGFMPYSITFFASTIQSSNVGASINNGRAISFIDCHFEAINGVINVAGNNVGGINNSVGIHDCAFENSCGINGGAGYLVNASGTTTFVAFSSNFCTNTPDTVVISTSPANVSSANNQMAGSPVFFSGTGDETFNIYGGLALYGANGQNTVFDTSGKLTKSNGKTLAGNGLPILVASVSLTAQTAALGTTTLYTPTVTGLYRLNYSLTIEVAGNAVNLTGTWGWTDAVAHTLTTANIACNTSGANSTSALGLGSIVFAAGGGVPITYAAALSGAIGVGSYGLRLVLEFLA